MAGTMSSLRAVFTGFLIAPFVAALPIPALLDGGFNDYLEPGPWEVVLPFVYGTAAILGIPAYLAVRNWLAYTKTNLAIVGAIVAIVPAIVVFPKYWVALPFIAGIGICGAIGGLVFWYITRPGPGMPRSIT